MISPELAKQLQHKLILLVGEMDIQQLCMISYKWGGYDGLYHSYNHMLKNFTYIDKSGKSAPLETKDKIRNIENDVVDLIEAKVTRIFDCISCNRDLRKTGLASQESCFIRKHIFVNGDGEIARGIEETRENFNFREQPQLVLSCLHCGHAVNGNSLVFDIVRNQGFKVNSVLQHILKYQPELQNDMNVLLNLNKKSIDQIYHNSFQGGTTAPSGSIGGSGGMAVPTTSATEAIRLQRRMMAQSILDAAFIPPMDELVN